MNAPPVLDLLRERREAIGQQALGPYLAERRPLLVRGALIGGSVLGVVLLPTLFLFGRHLFVKTRMSRLEQYEVQAESLRTQLSQRTASRDQLVAANRKLARSLTSVRASSALLSELQLRTPDGVQLLEAKASGSLLQIKGRARDPRAFTRINALQLELKDSALMDSPKVTLLKVNREAAKGGGGEPAAGPPPVAFQISGPFADLPAATSLDLLQRVGSDGMARRLELLQREDLLP